MGTTLDAVSLPSPPTQTAGPASSPVAAAPLCRVAPERARRSWARAPLPSQHATAAAARESLISEARKEGEGATRVSRKEGGGEGKEGEGAVSLPSLPAQTAGPTSVCHADRRPGGGLPRPRQTAGPGPAHRPAGSPGADRRPRGGLPRPRQTAGPGPAHRPAGSPGPGHDGGTSYH